MSEARTDPQERGSATDMPSGSAPGERSASSFVLHLSGDPGIDMWWSNWIIIDLEERADQDTVNAVTENIDLPEYDVEAAAALIQAELRATWPSARVRPARCVFGAV